MDSNLTIQGVINILNGFACWLYSIVIAVIIIFIIIAGFRYMAAGGNSERINQAKKNFGWLLIGILVIFAVNVILQSVAAGLGSTDPIINNLIPFQCNGSPASLDGQGQSV